MTTASLPQTRAGRNVRVRPLNFYIESPIDRAVSGCHDSGGQTNLAKHMWRLAVIRKAIRTATILLATLGVSTAVLATALPAGATSGITGSMCEVNGHGYCLNTANFNAYTPVTESGSGARTIKAVLQSNGTYLLEFNGDTSKCVAANNNNTIIEVKVCNGSDGVVWKSAASGRWINQQATNEYGVNYYLAGLNHAGDTYTLAQYGASGSGTYQEFYFLQ
jgi:hypothetical protein